jgi:centrin-1
LRAQAAAGYNPGKFYRRKKELTDDQLTEIQDSFDLFTKDTQDGSDPAIDAEDLLVVMRALGHEPRKEDLKKLVSESVKDNTGQLDFDGYLNIILNKMAERPNQEDLRKAFRLFDQGAKKRIDMTDLRRIADQIGEQIEDDELDEMIRMADHSGTGEVSQEDFASIVTSYARHYDGEK